MRRTDIVARYGGEEFVILMPGTPRDAALLRMEALRQEIVATPIDLGEGRSLTLNFSAGVAGTPADKAVTPKALLSSADAASSPPSARDAAAASAATPSPKTPSSWRATAPRCGNS